MSACYSIDAFHVCISGFTQRVDRPTGLHDLWLRLGGLYRSPQTVVELRAWNSNFAELAESIKIARGDCSPLIVVYAYSWGAGWGFVQLAKELRHRGLRIASAVLCDPVYRSRWINGRWRSLWPFGEQTILIPDNVGMVRWLYQRENLPHGHRPVAIDQERTTIARGLLIEGVEHSSMDDCDQFRELAMAVANDPYRSTKAELAEAFFPKADKA
jgi:hypothetical protein